MFSNLFNQIIVLIIGVISLNNTYANVEYFTSAAPSIYGESLSRKIGIVDGNEYYIKNINYDINEIDKKNRGIGYIEGEINKEIYAEYMLNLQNFDKYSKQIESHPLKGNKLNVVYQKNDKKIIKYIPFNFFVKNPDAKIIKSWFDKRANIISSSENHNLKTGFFINHTPLSVQDNFLILKLKFVNNSNSDIKILDIKEWKKDELEKYKQYGVKLVLKSDYDFFSYYLTEANVINIGEYDEGLIIPKNGFLKLDFKINQSELNKFYDFKKNNLERNFVSYVSLKLNVISPSLIRGGFLYETEHYDFK